MNSETTDRRKFLALSGATAIVAGLQPQTLLAADDPMSLATFQSQNWSQFQFYDESGAHQSNMWLYQVEDKTVEAAVEQFSLGFFSVGEAALPDGIYYVTSPTGETLMLNTELKMEDQMYAVKYYRVNCALLQT